MSRVLIAEDDVEQLRLLADVLRLNGLTVVEATDGLEAANLAFADPPDIVLLDLMLPTMSGLDVAKLLSDADATKHIPIIAISGLQTDGARRAALASGCTTYLNKPFSPMALVAEVKHWLMPKQRNSGAR